jgi:hypothetical protein
MTAPPGKYVSLYITAKLIHSHMLADLRKDWPSIYFTARWPLTAQLPSEQAKPAALWTRDNETDMLAAQAVMGYSHIGESTPLRDPLWELGEAHAHRKPIYLVGPIERFGKYAFCSSVIGRAMNIITGLTVISRMNNYDSHAEQLSHQISDLAALFKSSREGNGVGS